MLTYPALGAILTASLVTHAFAESPGSVVPWMQEEYDNTSDTGKKDVSVKPVRNNFGIETRQLAIRFGMETRLSELMQGTNGSVDIWQGIDHEQAALELQYFAETPFRTLNLLVRDLLMTATSYPENAAQEMLAMARVEALYKYGDIQGANNLGRQLGWQKAIVNRFFQNTELLLGRETRLCLDILRLPEFDNADLEIFCLIVSGQRQKAEMRINLLSSQTGGESAFFDLFFVMLDPSIAPYIKLKPEYMTPLGITILRYSNYPMHEDIFDYNGSLSVLLENSLYRIPTPSLWGFLYSALPTKVRVKAAEELFAAGVIEEIKLEKLYGMYFSEVEAYNLASIQKNFDNGIIPIDTLSSFSVRAIDKADKNLDNQNDANIHSASFDQRIEDFRNLATNGTSFSKRQEILRRILSQWTSRSFSQNYIVAKFVSRSMLLVDPDYSYFRDVVSSVVDMLLLAGYPNAAERWGKGNDSQTMKLKLFLASEKNWDTLDITRVLENDGSADRHYFIADARAVIGALQPNELFASKLKSDSLSDYYKKAQEKKEIAKILFQVLNIIGSEKYTSSTDLFRALEGLKTAGLEKEARMVGLEAFLR
jgi:hypothetical protein